MGASSSTPRTVSVDNDSPAGVIDISDDVVQRLKTGLPPKEGKKTEKLLNVLDVGCQKTLIVLWRIEQPTDSDYAISKTKMLRK